MNGPHRMVGGFLDGAARQVKSIGADIQSVLDKPPDMVGIRPAPNRIPDSIFNGLVNAWQAAGKGVSDALDQPLEVISNIRRRF